MTVSLPPARSASAAYFGRISSSTVMSALSNCVTCGIGDQAWLRCSAVFRRTPVMGLRSTSPHFVKSGNAGPPPGARPAPGASAPPPRLLRICRANVLTSSSVMRPFGPEPVT